MCFKKIYEFGLRSFGRKKDLKVSISDIVSFNDGFEFVVNQNEMAKELKFLVIHCTATPEGRDVTAEDIRRWHLSPVSQGGRGWKQVGYSWLVQLNGNLVTLVDQDDDQFVDPWEITNGVAGLNSVSNHIVYAGGMDSKNKNPKDTRTEAQKLTLKDFVFSYIQKHPQVKVAGHYHFASKACPSFNVEKWLEEIGVPSNSIYRK